MSKEIIQEKIREAMITYLKCGLPGQREVVRSKCLLGKRPGLSGIIPPSIHALDAPLLSIYYMPGVVLKTFHETPTATQCQRCIYDPQFRNASAEAQRD